MIKIITIGKIKEPYLKEAIFDYYNRLAKYHKVELLELQEINTDDITKNLNKEAETILNQLKTKDYIIVLDKEGKNLSSEALSELINNNIGIHQNLVFVIGSSHGLNKSIKDKANLVLSFGNNTYPHQLFRLILLEQLYRSFKIINNEPYHK